MKALVYGFSANQGPAVFVDVWDGTGTNLGTYNLVTPFNYTDTTASDFMSDISAGVISGLASNAITIVNSDIQYLWNIIYGTITPTFNFPSLAVNTARQMGGSLYGLVTASVDITATLSLVTGQTGKITLQYADDSGFTTNVKIVQPSSNGNTGSLTIGLNLGQIVTATVTGMVPAGKYYRILTTNVTGTPTYGTPVIQEVTF